MKKFHILLFCIFFYNPSIIKSQTGCDFSAIRSAFAASGNYTEVTGVSGQPCSMYFINTKSQDADLSEQEAQTLGAHMAVFNTAAENSAVTSAVYASFSGNIWIGYKRTSTGATTFYAMDGTTPSFTPGAATASFYQNWASGEPNNFQYQSCGTGCTGSLFFPCTNVYLCTNGEQCTQVYSNASWNDLPCNSNSTSIVEVNLCPVTTINPSATIICGGGSVSLPCSTILGSAPYTYSWTSSPAGFTSTSANPTVTPLGNTTYFVTAIDRYGCTSQSSVTIIDATVNVAPIAPITICPGISTSLTAVATGGNGAYTYSWTPAGTGNTAIVNVSPSITTNYTVIVSDSNGCKSLPVVVTVTVNNVLNVTVNSPNLCFGESAVLSASGASNYTWMPATYLSSTTGATVTCTPTANMSYTVTGTSGGCVGTVVSTVNINPTPDSYAGADITICSGATGTIGAANTPGYLYSWLPVSDLISSTLSNPLVNPTNYTASPITINYVVTTSPAGCFSKDTVLVTVNPSINPAFFYSSSTFCKTASATNPSATTTLAGGAFTFTPAGLSIDVNTGLIDLLLSSFGTYTVTYSFNGACPSSSSTTITITDTPKAQFSYGTYCKNAANPVAQIAAGSSAGKFSSSAGLVFANTSTGLLNLTASTVGTYTVTNTIIAGVSCSATVYSNTITINPVPVTLVDNQTVCNGTLVTLTASGAVSYLWSDGSSGTTLTITAAGAASYTVTGSLLGCTSKAVGNIFIKALPTVTVNNATICVGQSTTLNASGGATYTWLPGGTTASSLTITPSAITSYTVSDNTPGCSGFAVSNITVNLLPIITINAPSICLGKSASLMASGAATYLWIGGSTVNPYTVSPTINTTYSVTGISATGCIGKGNTSVTVYALPIVTAASASVCLGKSASLMASGASTYLWSNGSTANPLTISPSSTTTYTVTGNDVNGCINSGISTIKTFPKPVAQFSTSPEIATKFNSAITFNNLSTVDVNYWFWDFGDGETLAGSIINPIHNYPGGDTGTFKAILIVHNAGFCYDTVNHFVMIGPEYSFYIPNAFTPDGDGKNDFFFGKGLGILEYQLSIFDRWGNFIFSTNDINKGWDGKANGGIESSQQDVYIWKVQLKNIYLKQHNYTGTVTILLGK